MSRLSAARARLLTGLLLGGACASVFAASAASAAGLPTPSVSKTTVGANEYFTISGTGCVDPVPGAPLPGVSVSGHQIGDGEEVAPDGSWSLSESFSGAEPGTYAIQATCMRSDGNVAYPSVSVTVAGAPAPQPPAPQPPAAQPTATAARPPAAAPTTASRTTTPRTTAPTTTAPTTAATGTPAAPTPTPSMAATASAALAPAPGCTDCAALSGHESLTAGRKLSLRYSGFQPGEQITLTMRSTPVVLGTFTADASGVVSADVTIPASAEAGAHTLTLAGPLTGDRVVAFRLAAAQQREASAAPAAEGTDLTLPVILGGVVLVGLAVGALLLSRRGRGAAPEKGSGAGTGQPIETPIAERIA